jgi:hypothetical protein
VKDLSNLLKRLSNTLNSKTLAKESVIEAVKKYTNITLKEESISIKSDEGVLELNTSPVIKNEILLKEPLILGELGEVYNLKLRRILYK